MLQFFSWVIQGFLGLDRRYPEDNSWEKERREYKYAHILPHINKLPWEVVEIMLDHDLIEEDDNGNTITCQYELLRRDGRVQQVINEARGKVSSTQSSPPQTS